MAAFWTILCIYWLACSFLALLLAANKITLRPHTQWEVLAGVLLAGLVLPLCFVADLWQQGRATRWQ